jgi:rsbT co-antagonist protein RsbR
MDKLNQALYEYVESNIQTITEKWLQTRKKEKGSIYSADMGQDVEDMLRKQNTLTNFTILSVLLDDTTVHKSYLDKWTEVVATSRIKTDTPIYEVIDALSNVQRIFMGVVIEFIHANMDKVFKDEIIRWNTLFNDVFCDLKYKFSSMYYKLMNRRLSSQQKLIDELNIPIIPISEEVAILALQGHVDTSRMKQIYDALPEKVVEANVEYLYIDLSGIQVMDTYVANELLHVINLLKMLGITPALSGISPEVAQSIAPFQNSFKNIKTYSTLKQALSQIEIGN